MDLSNEHHHSSFADGPCHGLRCPRFAAVPSYRHSPSNSRDQRLSGRSWPTGKPRPSFPVLRKHANCITAGTSRRAVCAVPPGQRLHLRSGPNAEAAKAHRVDPCWTKAALLLLVSLPRRAPMNPALNKCPTCTEPVSKSARWHRREEDDFETIMETGVVGARMSRCCEEDGFLGFAGGLSDLRLQGRSASRSMRTDGQAKLGK
jgi:hypothetical protein